MSATPSVWKPKQARARSFYPEFFRKTPPRDHTHYCPGCGHGVIHKLIAEAIDDFKIQDRTVLISPVGCSVFAYYYFDVGNIQAAHGRAGAVATAAKRALPEAIVLAYQGDGDLAAIGLAETMHAANRGEPFTLFFVNNAIYGMTGGQMAPTTLLGQKTTTSPFGRGRMEGAPLRICELLSQMDAPAFLERVAVFDGKSIMRARRAIRKAIENQVHGRGFSLVEILSPCPTAWNVTPVEAAAWVKDAMVPAFPLGNFRDRPNPPEPLRPAPPPEEIHRLLQIGGVTAGEAETLGADKSVEQAINISGFGGQGVMYLGRVLAEAGMRAGLRSSFLPSYGPEMRGGTAHCSVCLSGREIGSPLATRPTLLVAMNEPSLQRFHSSVLPGGLILYNGLAEHFQAYGVSSELRTHAIQATEIADGLGSARLANMVILGAIVACGDFLSAPVVEAALDSLARSPAGAERNRKCFHAGLSTVAAAKCV